MAADGSVQGPSLRRGFSPENQQTVLDMASNGNYFCSVNLGQSSIRVILYFSEGNPLGHTLLRRCREADYECGLVHTHQQAVDQLSRVQYQDHAVIVVNTHTSMRSNLEELTKYIHTHGLHHTVTLVAVLPDVENNRTTQALMKELLDTGVSRVLTSEDCRSETFLWVLQMVERNEVKLKQKFLFGMALFEAVEQSNDAIQITGPNSLILYVNRSFVDLSGYSRDEALGKPAMDILKCYDSKWDNGPKGAFAKKEQRWDGECMGRRKSGSVLKQHLKLIPVRSSANEVYHHVTIQRLLSSHDPDHTRSISQRYASNGADAPMMMRKQPSLGWLPRIPARMETPFSRTVQTITSARDHPECPSAIRDALDRTILDIMSSSELYYPIAEDPRTKGSIVSGLLNTGRRLSVDMTAMRSHSHHHSRHTLITPPPPHVEEALLGIGSWDFDIFRLEEATSHEALYYAGMKIFKKFDLCEVLNVDDSVLASWLKLMERNYHHSNPYHNSTHAADVLQSTAYMVDLLQDYLISQGDKLEPIELAALVITAVIHDLDHPGRTNPFLCNTRHEIAVLYNDNAVLENHHVAHSFKLTQQSKQFNIYKNLDATTYRTLRTSVIDLVLATDMAKHFEHLSKFSMSVLDDPGAGSTTSLNSKESRENRMVMKRILVKCADVSNPCRPVTLCRRWADKVAQEYFSQTEEEKERGLPVVFPDFDRQTCNIPVTQVKFIDYFISGLFEAWNNYCPIPVMVEHLNANYDDWKSQYNSPSSSEEEAEASSNSP